MSIFPTFHRGGGESKTRSSYLVVPTCLALVSWYSVQLRYDPLRRYALGDGLPVEQSYRIL
jgi:hypothetical protein